MSINCGYIALVGQPNVGKSTLMNELVGAKVSITSRKAQTTRHRILGILTTDAYQMVFVDTPGITAQAKEHLHRYLNRVTQAALHDVDIIVLIVDARGWNERDDWILKQLEGINRPVLLVLNKIDMLKSRQQLLPLLQEAAERYPFAEMIPISAKKGEQLDDLLNTIQNYLPEESLCFPPDQFTDRSDRFVATEIIREKLMRLLGHELPYSVTVTLDAYAEEKDIIRIAAVVWVAKASHKGIVIGAGGEQLKKIGSAARKDMEAYFEKQVYVQLWVKVKTKWTDDERALRDFGYEEQ